MERRAPSPGTRSGTGSATRSVGSTSAWPRSSHSACSPGRPRPPPRPAPRRSPSGPLADAAGTCPGASCSLRTAIAQANADPDCTRIEFDFTPVVGGYIALGVAAADDHAARWRSMAGATPTRPASRRTATHLVRGSASGSEAGRTTSRARRCRSWTRAADSSRGSRSAISRTARPSRSPRPPTPIRTSPSARTSSAGGRPRVQDQSRRDLGAGARHAHRRLGTPYPYPTPRQLPGKSGRGLARGQHHFRHDGTGDPRDHQPERHPGAGADSWQSLLLVVLRHAVTVDLGPEGPHAERSRRRGRRSERSAELPGSAFRGDPRGRSAKTISRADRPGTASNTYEDCDAVRITLRLPTRPPAPTSRNCTAGTSRSMTATSAWSFWLMIRRCAMTRTGNGDIVFVFEIPRERARRPLGGPNRSDYSSGNTGRPGASVSQGTVSSVRGTDVRVDQAGAPAGPAASLLHALFRGRRRPVRSSTRRSRSRTSARPRRQRRSRSIRTPARR